MLATQQTADAALAPSSALLLVACGVAFLWLLTLTVVVLRRRPQPWHDDGIPVFRRLPDGRVRFSWAVAAGLGRAQRTAAVVDLHHRDASHRPDHLSGDHRVQTRS